MIEAIGCIGELFRRRREPQLEKTSLSLPLSPTTAPPSPNPALRAMADFSHLSSPESDDSAVEKIILQAMDLSALEQIAALNSPHSSDSLLPSHLETRFRKLKSFPVSNSNLKTQHPYLNLDKSNTCGCQNICSKTPTSSPDKEDTEIPSLKSELESPPKQGRKSSDQSPTVQPDDVRSLDPKLGIGSISSPSIPYNSSFESSPPRQTCCFWRSPKKVPRKKNRGDGLDDFDLDDGYWGTNDEILSDLRTFSLKEHRRKLKKAWKEQEKVTKEAEKLVELAKQVSSRFDDP